MKNLLLTLCSLPGLLTAQPVTLTLSGPSTVYPGQSLPATLGVSGTAASGLVALEWQTITPTGIGFSSAAPTTFWSSAGYATPCNTLTALCVMINEAVATPFTDGPVATVTFSVSASALPGAVTIPLSSVFGANAQGLNVAMTLGVAYSVTILSPCNFNGGSLTVADIQLILNAVLGTGPCPVGVTSAGRTCNLGTLQQEIVAVLGQPCLI